MMSVSALTIISGTIYSADYTQKIGDANVQVSCVHGNDVNILNTTSASSGTQIGDYQVSFLETLCEGEDTVTVIATKGDLIGVMSEDVVDRAIMDIDLAIINVPLTPEFGVIAGMITLLGAVGLFFSVRK